MAKFQKRLHYYIVEIVADSQFINFCFGFFYPKVKKIIQDVSFFVSLSMETLSLRKPACARIALDSYCPQRHDKGNPRVYDFTWSSNTLSSHPSYRTRISPLNAELNPIRRLLALVGARHIVHVSRIRFKCVVEQGTKENPKRAGKKQEYSEKKKWNLRNFELCTLHLTFVRWSVDEKNGRVGSMNKISNALNNL